MNNSFTLSKALDKNKVFILNWKELGGRFDPSWYCYLKSIEQFHCKKVLLKNLLLRNPQYGANEAGIDRKNANEPRYVRITDINEFGDLCSDLGKTAANVEEKYFLEENDLLLARSGNTVGKSYLHKNTGYQCFFAGYMIRFKIDESKALPSYIFAFTQTKIYKNWVDAIQRTTGQPNINAEEYKNLEIPLPSKEIQKKIANTYSNFIEGKKRNEAEAEKLLAGIDDYLIKELGIELPPQQENILKSRVFFISSREIHGGRFDPFFNLSEFRMFFKSLSSGTYYTKDLGSFSRIGSGAIVNTSEYEESGIPLIRIQNILQNGLDLGETKYISEKTYEKEASAQIKEGEILFGMSGTVGRAAIVQANLPRCLLNQRIAKLTLDSGVVNKVYVKEVLNSSIGIKQFIRIGTGGIQTNISNDDIKRLLIPIPPLPKQQEIADHITNIRKRAQELKDQTKIALEQSNKAIEQLLLGS